MDKWEELEFYYAKRLRVFMSSEKCTTISV